MKSTQIETELNSVTVRLDELTEMRGGVNTNLQTLQQGFIDGTTTLDELQSEQGKLTTLDSSITALEAKQDELHSAFQKASASENRQSLLEKSKGIAIEAESFYNEYSEMRNDFHNLIRDYAEKLVDKSIGYRNKQRDFERITNQIQSNFKELEQIGLSAETHNIVTASYINYPPFEYGEAVVIAENLRAASLNKKVQAERATVFAADRAKIQAAQKIERQKEEDDHARKTEAARQQIIQYRIDAKLPALSPQDLKNAVNESQARKADAIARGARV